MEGRNLDDLSFVVGESHLKQEIGDGGEASSRPSDVLDPGEYIIPPGIARPVFYISNLMLCQAAFAFYVAAVGGDRLAWGVAVIALALWFTSVNFWRSPKRSWRRYADFFMVGACVAYGTAVAFLRGDPPRAVWIAVWLAIAAVFAANEARFWTRCARTVRDYQLVVWVHAGGVHLPGNAVVAYLTAALLPA